MHVLSPEMMSIESVRMFSDGIYMPQDSGVIHLRPSSAPLSAQQICVVALKLLISQMFLCTDAIKAYEADGP